MSSSFLEYVIRGKKMVETTVNFWMGLNQV